MKTVAISGNEVGILIQFVNYLANEGDIGEGNFFTPEAKALFYKARSVKDENEYRIVYVGSD